MAFALTACLADGVRYSGPTVKHGEQVLYFKITAANTDVDLDIGDSDGTFWTAAIADATYGALAQAVNTFLFADVASVNGGLLSTSILDGQNRYQGAAASGVVFTLTPEASLPDYLFASGSAPTSYTVVVKAALVSGSEPVHASYGSI